MFPKETSRFFLLITICVIKIVNCNTDILALPGFTYLGNISDVSGEKTGITNTLYLSDESHKLSRNESSNECEINGGRLLHILNREIDMQVRIMIITSSNEDKTITTWTSGIFQYDSNIWEWESVGRPIVYSNWINGATPSVPNGGCSGVALVSKTPHYAWVPMSCSSKYKMRFICIL